MSSQSDGVIPSKENIFAIADAKDFGKQLSARVKDSTQNTQGTPFALHYANVGVAYTHLYGLDIEGVGANAAVITRSGEQGSIAELRIPAAAGQLRKVWNLIVGPELAWTAIATSTDYASEAQAITAKNALQYYWADKGVATKAKEVAFDALSIAEGALHIPWNDELGEDLMPEPLTDDSGADVLDENQQPQVKRMLKTGDIDYRIVRTWDIIRDPTAKSFEASPWIIIREWQNKHDVAARCKDEDARNAALSSAYNPQDIYKFWRPFNTTGSPTSELIPVYYLYHRRTASVWRGRQTEFLENGTVITDAPLDKAYWKQLPVVRMAVDEYKGTAFPYTKFFGVLGSAQGADGLAKDLLTNATATASGLISVEEDANFPTNQLGGGPKVITRPKGTEEPKPINLQLAHPESFKLMQTLRVESQQILGLDNLTAGQDVGANLSGDAMALMTSTSVQNNSQEQAKWGEFVQGIGNVTLEHIRYHMKEPRKIALAGKARADMVVTTELSGEKVAGIDRLQVQLAPALQQTTAGKMTLANQALKEQWAKTPQQLQAVYDTGRLDALTEDTSAELMLIENENEALARGEQVAVMSTDDHVLHLKGHRKVTASVTARQNKAIINARNAHDAMHLEALRTTDPHLLQLLGQPSFAPPPQPGPPPVPEATKMAAANLAVAHGWAPTAQAAQQVFETGRIDAAQAQVNPAAAGNPPPGSAVAPQQQALQKGPRLPVNPQTGHPAGPVAGTLPPALAIKGP